LHPHTDPAARHRFFSVFGALSKFRIRTKSYARSQTLQYGISEKKKKGFCLPMRIVTGPMTPPRGSRFSSWERPAFNPDTAPCLPCTLPRRFFRIRPDGRLPRTPVLPPGLGNTKRPLPSAFLSDLQLISLQEQFAVVIPFEFYPLSYFPITRWPGIYIFFRIRLLETSGAARNSSRFSIFSGGRTSMDARRAPMLL